MRLLILHVSRFACTATQKGRSALVEPLPARTNLLEDGLLILASAEAGDERAPAIVANRAADDLAGVARQVGVSRALVHPFAHLFAEPTAPEAAVSVLETLCQALRDRGLEASRSPFGWFFSWELSAKGHPLSRLARRYTSDE